MNSLFQQLNPKQSLANALPNNVTNMIRMFKAMKNPQAFVQQAMQNNPQLKSAVEMANGDPEQAFRSMAKQMNVDPDEIIAMLK